MLRGYISMKCGFTHTACKRRKKNTMAVLMDCPMPDSILLMEGASADGAAMANEGQMDTHGTRLRLMTAAHHHHPHHHPIKTHH